MGILIGLIIGFNAGVIFMCIFQVNNKEEDK